jgi:hypothetical protein
VADLLESLTHHPSAEELISARGGTDALRGQQTGGPTLVEVSLTTPGVRFGSPTVAPIEVPSSSMR